jgi:predicted LPLAT superfamily acyltransferase
MSHWSQLVERGSALGIRIAAACYRLIGERAAKLLLYPVVGYFLVTGAAARRASRDYFARLQRFAGEGAGTPAPGWATSFRHMMAFAESALHKLAAWMGRGGTLNVEFPDRARLDALLASGKGALLVGAHLGNLEMTRALASGERRVAVNAVIYSEHAPAFQQVLAAANPEFAVNLIHVTRIGPETSIVLKEKVERGELLVIVGDRTPPAENGRVCSVDFLGAPADFAQGPFVLASLLECPVYLFFCLREGDSYRMYLEPFAERVELPRKERDAALREYVRRYARRLEEHCLRYPYQWFNFYDYWQQR